MRDQTDLRLTARPWQQEALRTWLGVRRGVVSVVTGAGKTIFALLCYAHIRKQAPDMRLAVVVPTIALLDQWAVALQCDLGIDTAEIATYSGEGKAGPPTTANVLVINTARDVVSTLTQTGKWMLVVDECHRAGSAENSRALRGRFVATLGISATPQRQYDDGFHRYVEPNLGPVIFEYDYRSALKDAVIAPFDVMNVEFPLTEAERKKYDQLSRGIRIRHSSGTVASTSAQDEHLVRLLRRRASLYVNAKWRIPTAIAVLRSQHGKAIVFHERIAAAEEITRALRASDRRAVVYHSKIYGPARRENLRLFRVGAYDTIVTCRSLDEGLNVPDASVAIIAASTSSRRQRIQRLGRVLRATTPSKRAVVITLFATPAERRQLEAEQTHLTGVADVRWYKASLNGDD